jgi:hypothetical protein
MGDVPEVYAQHFELEPKSGRDSIQALTESLRSWVKSKLRDGADFEFGDSPVTREYPDGSIFRWEPFEESGIHLLDFSWRHPDQQDPSISWATKLSYFEEAGRAVASLRVFNTGPDTGDARVLLTTRPASFSNCSATSASGATALGLRPPQSHSAWTMCTDS